MPPQPVRVAAYADDDFVVIEDINVVAQPIASMMETATVSLTAAMSTARNVGQVALTQGNIANAHVYLRSFFDKFSADAVGGSNMTQVALRELSIECGEERPITTDLDGTKKFFRKRGWIRSFFARTGARAGDIVSIDQTAPYAYRITLMRHGV